MQKNRYYSLLLVCVILIMACTKKDVVPTTGGPGNIPSLTEVPKTYLALGDSYTIGQSVSVEERFPVQAAAALRAQGFPMSDPEIIAVTGWTTGNLLHAISQKNFYQTL